MLFSVHNRLEINGKPQTRNVSLMSNGSARETMHPVISMLTSSEVIEMGAGRNRIF